MTYESAYQPISTRNQHHETRQLSQLIQDVSKREKELEEEFQNRTSKLRLRFETEQKQLAQQSKRTLSDLDSEYLRQLEKARHDYEQQQETANLDRNVTSDDVSKHRADEIAAANENYENTVTKIEADFEEGEKNNIDSHQKFLRKCQSLTDEFQAELGKTLGLVKRRQCSLEIGEIPSNSDNTWATSHIKRYQTGLEEIQRWTKQVKSKLSSRYLDDGWTILLTILGSFAIGIALVRVSQLPPLIGGAAGFVSALVTSLLIHVVVKYVAKRSTAELMPKLKASVDATNESITFAPIAAKREHTAALKELKTRHDQQLEDAKDEKEKALDDAEQKCASRRTKLERMFLVRLQELETEWNEKTNAIRSQFGPMIEQKKTEFAEQENSLKRRFTEDTRQLDREYERHWSELNERWQQGVDSFRGSVKSMTNYCQANFPKWSDVRWDEWSSSNESLTSILIGQQEITTQQLADQLPSSEQLSGCPDRFQLPVCLAFPDQPSLILNAHDEGRDEAIRVMQNSMLRLLTSLPPGKVRFTIIDPTGLGQNFSAFMHLADFDEAFVTNRIWTESAHIAQRLADLTEHMENVIQKYLRNEFESIHEYNRHAGEVAEAFQILVVANFPANFSEDAVRRLVSITNSGPRCGVYTLLSCDTKLKLPRGFEKNDLQKFASTLNWSGDRFQWHEEDFQHCDVKLDVAPDETTTTAILKAVGKQAQDASRVEVPFETVVPKEEDWWTHDSGSQVRVPLGRAGAVRLLSMELGKGTSQHVLVSGKTGSGKSTLLHAMVTNLSLHYSPAEVEFYLIDFKKGVEFKAYADFALPHARVIAIESEREFGMSVLQRLDQELRQRGDMFRQAGVQSLAAFRKAQPETPMPRVLLIVDEFQEFFVNDDRIAHDASLLLDRLVRQGRAFGLHVILGSQTLAGAYSLARSTLGQMAVRVALQCSAADAHLILSEDNTAARLLSRPGEAIYNDANGLLEGNNPFQVVWLSDDQRANYLQQIQRLTSARELKTEPAIVFEGNASADPADNPLLCSSLESAPDPTKVSAKAWLGAAVAIKDPTSAEFRRQHASNLLMVGQRAELAAGILGTSILSLAASKGPREENPQQRAIKFYVFDGGRAENAKTFFGDRLTEKLPLDMTVVAPNRAGNIIEELSAEVKQRNDDDNTATEPIFLVIYDLARFRDLQSDDDFGFSSFGEEEKESAGKQLATILRDGPPVGIHTLVWSDSYNNVHRWFDRQTLREFGIRVLFQMSAVDSSNLIDSAAAGQLGSYRAIVYHDDQAEIEKFRPYAMPSDDWLDWVAERLENPSIHTDDDVAKTASR